MRLIDLKFALNLNFKTDMTWFIFLENKFETYFESISGSVPLTHKVL